ncbi:MAG: tetratricopeptide repeat protein [Acidobacteriota bacterium]
MNDLVAPPRRRVAQVLDSRYRLVRILGEGGMGRVFLAEDLLVPDSLVAVKTLSSSMLGPAALEGLRREFLVMARLRHPCLARVHDFGLDPETGEHYVTMEHVSGDTLADLLERKGPLDEARVFDTLVSLCRTMHFVHGRGILHRDLKPANLMSADGRLMVLDFGLADPDSVSDSTLSGTVEYLAPETLHQRGDRRSDVFSAGAAAYELLTGRTLLGDLATNERLILLSDTDAFESRRQQALEAVSSEGLRRVIGTMTAHDPDERPASFASVLLALNSALGRQESLEDAETRQHLVTGAACVGRDDELTALAALSEEPDATTRLTLVRGPIGIGKTRVLRELVQRLQVRGARTLETTCREAPHSPFEVAQKLTAEALLSTPDELVRSHGSELVKLLPDHPRLAGTTPAPRRDGPTERGVLIESLSSFLLEHARAFTSSTSIHVDGLHWADEESLAVLGELLFKQRDEEQRVPSLRLYASAADNTDWIHDQRERDRLHEIPLPPLSEEQTVTYLEAVFGRGSLLSSLREAVPELHRRVGGNPLMLQESVRVLIDSGAVRSGPEGWSLEIDLARLPAVEDPSGLMQAKIAALDLDEQGRAALELIAVLGREVEESELSLILPGHSSVTATSFLTMLEAKDVVLAVRSGQTTRYRISTEQLRLRILEEMTETSATHRHVAQRLEQLVEDEDKADAETLARHFDQGGDVDKARHWLGRAASSAQVVHANGRAVEHLNRLLTLLPDDDSERLSLLLQRGRLGEVLGRWDAAAADLDGALELARERDDRSVQAQVAAELGLLAQHRGDYDEAVRQLTEAERLFGDLDDREGLARTLGKLGAMALQRGQREDAEKHHQRELELAEGLGSPALIAAALGKLGNIYLTTGRDEEALTRYRRQLILAEKGGDLRGLANALGNLAIIHRRLGRYDKAVRCHERKLEVSRRIGDKQGLGITMGNLGVVQSLRGRPAEALDALTRQLDIGIEIGDRRAEATALGTLGDVHRQLGDLSSSEKSFGRALELCRELELKYYLGFYTYRMAELLADADRADESLALCEEAIRLGEEVDDPETVFPARCLHARLRHQQSPEQQAAALADLRTLLAGTDDEEAQALAHSTLFELSGDVEQGRSALALYDDLRQRSPNAEHASAFKRLRKALGDDVPEAGRRVGVSEHYVGELLDVSRQLSQSATSKGLLAKIVDLCLDFVRADRGMLLLPEGEEFTVRVAHGPGGDDLPEEQRRLSRTLVNSVLESHEPVFAPRIAEEDELARAESVQALDLRSATCLPLLAPEEDRAGVTGRRRLLGLLYLDGQSQVDEERFRGDDLEYLRSLADHAAIALWNSRIYSQLEQRVAEKTAELEEKVAALAETNDRLEQEIEARALVEEALIEAKLGAEQASKAKSEFLANMSHEIRTPMNAVIGMTSLLLDMEMSRQQREYVQTVRSSGDTLLTLINDILDFSRIESGKLELENRPFHLRDCMEEALDLVATKAGEKGLDLGCHVEARVPRWVVGDVTRLRQVFVNLVSNAVKFTEEGEVFVSVSASPIATDATEIRRSWELSFEVRDTGIGIPTDRKNRLFESFSQVDSSTTRIYGGTGLGLAICKRLVETMKGNIEVESRVGKGSIFRFNVPFQEADEPARAHERGLVPELEGRRVLVVDDNASSLSLLSALVRDWGLRPRNSVSLVEARKLLHEGGPFEAVLVDGAMPDFRPEQLVADLGASAGQRRHAVIATLPLGRQEPGFKEAGVHAVLSKPIKPRLLHEALLTAFHDDVQLDAPGATTTGPQVRTTPLRILLAEDNLAGQVVALALLERLGHQAEVVLTGKEVLAALEKNAYDLIFLDLHMPEMDGLECCRKIHEIFPPEKRPRIVALTASAMEEDRRACLDAGMDDYVAKPIERKALARVLAEVEPRVLAGEDQGEPPIDAETIVNLDDGGLLEELIELFLAKAPDSIGQMRAATLARDGTKLAWASHQFAGTCLYLGLKPLAALCEKLEIAGKKEELGNIDEIFRQFENECQRAQQALKQLRRD